MAWTPELIKDLKRLWNKGLTTVEIGNRIGMSKNAVVGKAHRLGLEGRPSPIKRDKNKIEITEPKVEKVLKEKKDTVKQPIPEIEPETLEPASFPPEEILKAEPIIEMPKSKKGKRKGVQLVDLKPTSCRWPEGDPKDPDFCFCGQECVNGKIYCEEHCAVAYTGIFKAR